VAISHRQVFYGLPQHENCVKLNLTKVINDAWSIDFGGRFKWDIDRLKPWVNIETVFPDNIMAHLASQFNITEDQWLEVYL